VELVTFFTGFATLCTSITGHVGIGTIIYTILNFAAVAVEAAVKYIMSHFLYGLTVTSSLKTQFLSPVINLYFECPVHKDAATNMFVFEGNGYPLALFFVGIAFFVIAYLFYKARHSEASGEIISAPSLRPVFKYCMAAGSAFILGVIFYFLTYGTVSDGVPNIILFTICMLIGSAIGYFVSEMLLKKSLRVLKRSYRGYLACALAVILFGGAIGFDFFGIVSKVPNGSDIKSVTLSANYADEDAVIYGDDEFLGEVLDLHRSIIRNKDKDIDIGHTRYSRDISDVYYNYMYLTFEYKLKDGSTIVRQYGLPVSEDNYGSEDIIVTELSGYLDSLRSIFSKPEVVKRGFASLWDTENCRLYEAHVFSIDNSSVDIDYYLSAFNLPELRRLVAEGLESGRLTGHRFDMVGKKGDPDDYIELTLSFSEDGHTRRVNYFYVTRECDELFYFLRDSNNWETGDEVETFDQDGPVDTEVVTEDQEVTKPASENQELNTDPV